jgi:hypothetical protein
MVMVRSGTVKTFQRDPRFIWDVRLRASLASCHDKGDWPIDSESRAVRLMPALGLDGTGATVDTTTRALRDTLRFAVALPPGNDPARSWLAFVFEWPFENVLATYVMHTNAPLNGGASRTRADEGSTVQPISCH